MNNSSTFDDIDASSRQEMLDRIFISILIVLLVLANILMGCQLDLYVVWQTIRRPISPMIGFVTQFLLMPLLSYAIGQLILVRNGYHSFALGLFVTGCSPGGGASNFWTILLEGNVHLSITMTFLSTVASFGMMPMWIWLLGEQFIIVDQSTTNIKIPYRNIVTSLATLVPPLLIGVAIRRFRPSRADRLHRALRPFIIMFLVFILTFGVYVYFDMLLLITWSALLAGLLLPLFGFMFGCLISIILRRSPADVTAIAIETGIQNTGIAIVLLKFSFATDIADASSLLPIIVACFTPLPLLVAVGVHMLIKWLRNTTKYNNTNGVDRRDSVEIGPISSASTNAVDVIVANTITADEVARNESRTALLFIST